MDNLLKYMMGTSTITTSTVEESDWDHQQKVKGAVEALVEAEVNFSVAYNVSDHPDILTTTIKIGMAHD